MFSLHPHTMTEVPLSKARNPNCSRRRRSIKWQRVHGVCVFTAVCVHLEWVKCRAQIPSMGQHTWPYVTFTFHFTRLVKTHAYHCPFQMLPNYLVGVGRSEKLGPKRAHQNMTPCLMSHFMD